MNSHIFLCRGCKTVFFCSCGEAYHADPRNARFAECVACFQARRLELIRRLKEMAGEGGSDIRPASEMLP